MFLLTHHQACSIKKISKKVILLLVCLLNLNTLVFSQSTTIDSLFLALEEAEEDSIKVDVYHSIADLYNLSGALDSASIFIEKAISLADTRNFDTQRIRAIHLGAVIFQTQGKDSLAKERFLIAKNWYEKSGHEYDRFEMNANLGCLYGNLGNILKATIHFDSAEIYRLKDNLKQEYDLNWYLGGFYWKQKKYDDARNKYLKSVELSKLLKDSILLYFAYGNLGSLYNDLQKPDSAILYLELAMPVVKKYDPDWAYCLQGCLGTNYKDLGDCKKAIYYFQESLTNIKIPDESFECCSLAEMASCYLIEGDLEKAEYYNNLSISLMDKAPNSKLKQDAFKELVSLYKMRGDYERALLNMESLKKLEDEQFTSENSAAIEELKLKFQTRDQETQMELQDLKLDRQSSVIAFIVGLLTLLSIILFLAWRNVRYRKRSNRLLEERNAHLEDLDQKKSRFFSNISHELRTPLTLVTAPLEKAFDSVKDKETQENLHLAYRSSQKLLVLVDEILDLSKLESGQMELHPSSIQLEEVLRRIFFAFQSLADISKLKLEFNSQLLKDYWVNVDLPKLEKILNNLLSNAIKYSDPGGKIYLNLQIDSSSYKNENFIIQVTDTGKGIPVADLPKIFDRFYQANSGQMMGGTGIGLALSKELVNLFGGTIEVNSELGKGSTFTLMLPLIVIKKPVQVPGVADGLLKVKRVEENLMIEKTDSKSYKPILLDGQKPKVLIVEDNLEMSRFLNQTLSTHFECDIAYNGNEAIEKLKSAHFDVVTSDVMMPQMDGFAFLEKVRMEGTIFKSIPFILLTARSLERDKLDGFQLGVDDYITKPFSVKELIARIQNLLKNKEQREEFEIIESVDRKSLKVAEQIVLDHLSDSSFGSPQLSNLLAMSQRSLERFIKRLTGLSPVGFIREIRLQKAYQMLKRRQFLTVLEVRYEVGIENASYFNRKFKERFGINPSDLLRPTLKDLES